jgi:hypothetical protein
MSVPTTQKKSPWPWVFGIGCGLPVLAFVGCAGLGAIMMAANPDLKKQVEQQSKGTY